MGTLVGAIFLVQRSLKIVEKATDLRVILNRPAGVPVVVEFKTTVADKGQRVPDGRNVGNRAVENEGFLRAVDHGADHIRPHGFCK